MNPLNQKGISSFVLMIAIVLGVFMLWEVNEYISNYTNPRTRPIPPGSDETGPTTTFCATGEEGNCNDSNDQFIFSE